MLPTVFLSLEGAEQEFVDKVRRFLPDGLPRARREEMM